MEDKCPVCHGKGEVDKYHHFKDGITMHWILRTKICLKCHGTGKLDWIKNVTGLDNSELYLKVMQHKTTSFEKEDFKEPDDM